MLNKQQWLKERLLLNLGFAPKLFGYTDDDLFGLTQGSLKKHISGVEYYFGIGGIAFEKKADDFPRQLVDNKLITVMHAPFVKEKYPFKKQNSVTNLFYAWHSLRLSQKNKNTFERLSFVIDLCSRIHARKINLHASEFIFEADKESLFKKVAKRANQKNITLCLENNRRPIDLQKKDKPEWAIAHDPILLLEYLKQHRITSYRLTIDTAHLRASGYDVLKKWNEIKKELHKDINAGVSHFHIVDYEPNGDFDAVEPGKGCIGKHVFQSIINDLFKLQYSGTISLEVAPLYYISNKPRMFFNAIKRSLKTGAHDLSKEEEYIENIILSLL